MRQKTCLLMATAVSLEQARDQEEDPLQVSISLLPPASEGLER